MIVQVGQLKFTPEYRDEFPEPMYGDIPTFWHEKDGEIEFWPIPNNKPLIIEE